MLVKGGPGDGVKEPSEDPSMSCWWHTKPLPESMLDSDRWGRVAFTRHQFRRGTCSRYQSVKCVFKITDWQLQTSPTGYDITAASRVFDRDNHLHRAYSNVWIIWSLKIILLDTSDFLYLEFYTQRCVISSGTEGCQFDDLQQLFVSIRHPRRITKCWVLLLDVWESRYSHLF